MAEGHGRGQRRLNCQDTHFARGECLEFASSLPLLRSGKDERREGVVDLDKVYRKRVYYPGERSDGTRVRVRSCGELDYGGTLYSVDA